MNNSHIFLTGCMGSGKSSVANLLSKLLNIKFIDLDAEIVSKTGRSINDIFSTDGENYFRNLEREALLHTQTKEKSIIATGGGVVINPENRIFMRQNGIVINLTAPIDQIVKRLEGCTERPLISGKNLKIKAERLMKKREKWYADSDIRIDTNGKSVEDVAEEIISFLKKVNSVNQVAINLAENSYTIHIGNDILPNIGKLANELGCTSTVAVVTNPVINKHFGKTVRQSLEETGCTVTTIEIPEGEEHKNLTTLSTVYDRLIEARLDRKSYIIALGGGVVGDLAGFAAATYLRGIPFIQIPTTLLAQVDSSVGGKTAVDHSRGKNLIGAFYQPQLVLIDVETLSTLPKREFCAGMAEVIKYGVAIDLPFFEYLETHADQIIAMDKDCLTYLISRCCELKGQVVELDEKESGLRAVLNYGHTLGHAYETLSGYREMVHGEAVSIGMILAARISAKLGLCSQRDISRIENLLKKFGLPTEIPDVDRQLLIQAISTDKKNRSGTINFIANEGIGNFIEAPHTPDELLALAGL